MHYHNNKAFLCNQILFKHIKLKQTTIKKKNFIKTLKLLDPGNFYRLRTF